ncbi:MAG: putative lipid II flippase FtsW [bacterium]|nr:putative lipid II flippase FtsW [bacterium]
MFKGFSQSGKTLVVLVLVLLALGLMMISSAGIIEGQNKFNDSYYYFKRQILFGVLPGLAIFFILSRIKYEFWRKAALPILLGAVGLTVAVFIPGVGQAIRGAQRWIDLGFFSIQPSEFLKLGLIIYLAALFSRREAHSKDWSYSLAPFAFVLAFILFLLAKQPDVGTLIVIVAVGIIMYFFADGKLLHIFSVFAVISLIIGILVWIAPYRLNRVLAFINPSEDVRGISYHINQALIGVGTGGIWGLGLGQSQQKLNYLPEPAGDSIFAVLMEELGFVGGVSVVGLFVALGIVLTKIAKKSRDSFGKLFCLGLASWILFQAFMNIAALTGLMPLTGIPLPFISYGSSALVAVMAGLGIAVNIANKS